MRLKKKCVKEQTRRHVSGLRLAQHEPSCHWCRWQHAQIENSVSQAVPTAAGRFCALAAGQFRTASDLLGFCGMYVFSFKVQGYHMKSHVFAVQKSKKPWIVENCVPWILAIVGSGSFWGQNGSNLSKDHETGASFVSAHFTEWVQEIQICIIYCLFVCVFS